jgi:HlyD family secretion protein
MLSLFGLAASSPAFTWSDQPHTVICQIAFDELNNAAKAEVTRLIKQDTEFTSFEELEDRLGEPTLSRIVSDQIHQFEERRGSLEGQKNILQSRIVQLQTEIDGVRLEKNSTEKQKNYIDEELVGLRELVGKNLVSVTQVYAMERERTRLEGGFGRAVADIAKAKGAIEEMNIQIPGSESTA